MLKQIPPASDVALPLARMFEAAEMVYLIPLDFSCHTGVFFTRLVIELVVVGFSTAGERYSRHGSITRSFFKLAADGRSHEGLRLPGHER